MSQFFIPQDVQNIFFHNMRKQQICHTSLLVGAGMSWLTQIAYNLATVLLCPNLDEQGRACGHCPHCNKIAMRTHPDVILIRALPGKTVIGIEQVQKDLIEQSILRPWESKYKIFILQESELLQREASNALLKILEEPPEHCILILTSQNADVMLPTILSRCQQFRVMPATEDCLAQLQNNYKISRLEAITVWNLSGQNPITSQELASQWEHRNRLLKACIECEDAMKAGDVFYKLCHAKQDDNEEEDDDIGESQPKAEVFIHYISSFWYDVFLMQRIQSAEEFILNQDQIPQIRKASEICNPTRVEHFLNFLLKLPHILTKANGKLFWKNLFVQNYLLFSK